MPCDIYPDAFESMDNMAVAEMGESWNDAAIEAGINDPSPWTSVLDHSHKLAALAGPHRAYGLFIRATSLAISPHSSCLLIMLGQASCWE